MKLSAYLVAPIVALSLACEPAGAGHTVDGALGGKKKPSQSLKDPSTIIKDASVIKPASKPVMDAASLLARAKAAGWSAADIKALKATLADVESLSDAEMNRARCRLGKVFQARKPVVLTALREAGATKAELESAGKAVDGIAAAMCTSALTTKKKDGSLKQHEAALGKVFVDVNQRLTAGTALEGHDVTLGAYEDLMREMNERCSFGNIASFKGLAAMSDAEFESRNNTLAFGNCGQRSAGAGGIAGLPNLPAGSDTDGYAQCVREAFREGVTSNANCGGIAGGTGPDGGVDPDAGGGTGPDEEIAHDAETEDPAPEHPNPAADEQDAESHETGTKYVIAGGLVVALGAFVVVVGAATSEVGVGVGIMAIGVGMIMYGVEQMDEADRNYTGRNHERPSWAWQCPTLSTPVGSFAFANPTTGGSSSAQPNMTVMDTLRACRCENNPLDDFLASGGTGAFGGPSCGLGSRLDCLRESGNDIGNPPSPECRMLLRGDNQVSIAAQLQECSVMNCGEGLVGDDCSCWSGGGGGGGSNPCATVQCPEGTQPIPEGLRCTCESDVPDGGSLIDCLPGTPGCGSNTIPGGLPGGGGAGPMPIPMPKPIPLPAPMPKSPFKK